MGCKHEHIRAVGFKLTCIDCGAALPDDYLERKQAPEESAKQAQQKPAKRKAKKEE